MKIAKEINMPVEDFRRLTNEPKPLEGEVHKVYYSNYACGDAGYDIHHFIKPTLKKYEDKTYKIFNDEDLARLKELINQYETMKENGTKKTFLKGWDMK